VEQKGDSGAMEQWYTLYTKPNAEQLVANSLETRGLKSYLPKIKVAKENAQKTTTPFFPCYLFSKIDFDTVGLSYVQWIPGLRTIVSFDQRPVPLPESMIELIRQKIDAINDGKTIFQPGEKVQITAGPFQGMLAIFDQPTTSAQRVQVLLAILGRASRVQVAANHLQKPRTDTPLADIKRPRGTRGRGRKIKQ
jgi:transcriptional antiterminator RfaH